MAFGRIKWFDPAKGYGFIERTDRNATKTKIRELFFHYTAFHCTAMGAIGGGFSYVSQKVKPGIEVTFDIYDTDKGYQARNVAIKEI